MAELSAPGCWMHEQSGVLRSAVMRYELRWERKDLMGDWPKHPDGTPKKLGEMTLEERRAQFKRAGARLQQQFEQPAFRAAISKILRD